MKKIHKGLIGLLGSILFSGIVYATVTIATTNKSTYIPWQGTPSGFYDAAHNVGVSDVAESRFSFISGTVVGIGSTILDNITGLTWQSDGVTQGVISWDNAKTYCADLTLGGQSDWRLPNIKELKSIVDLSKSNPSIDTTYFTVINNNYWSSTTSLVNTDYAWVIPFINGSSSFGNKTNSYYVRCVH